MRPPVDLDAVVATLDRRLHGAGPADIIAAALDGLPPGRLAVVSSFGTESAVLLKLVADIDRTVPVVFLDTGWLFEETLAYRHTLMARLGLSDVRVIAPSVSVLNRQDPRRELWFTDPDACCRLRKVVPLEHALLPFDGWINGRKRYHGDARSGLPIVERDGRRLKFNPMANVPRDEIVRMFAAFALPRHPLEAAGYTSIGCMPCTSRVLNGESARAGRWRGRGKTECGIHVALAATGEPGAGQGDSTGGPTT